MSTTLNVRIINDFTGEVEADVDGTSTADALAYFLRSRGIDPASTETMIRNLTSELSDTAMLLFEQRDPMSGELLCAYYTEVHGPAEVATQRDKGT